MRKIALLLTISFIFCSCETYKQHFEQAKAETASLRAFGYNNDIYGSDKKKPDYKFIESCLKKNQKAKDYESWPYKNINTGSSLYYAIEYNDLEVFKIVEKYNKNLVDETYYGQSLVTASASLGGLNILKYIVGKGYDVNKSGLVKEFGPYKRYRYAFRPLDAAVFSNQVEAVTYLLANKAKANHSSLNHAIISRFNEIAKILIESGMNVNSLDRMDAWSSAGEISISPYLLSVIAGNEEMTNFIKVHGGNDKVQDSTGMSVAKYASLKKNTTVGNIVLCLSSLDRENKIGSGFGAMAYFFCSGNQFLNYVYSDIYTVQDFKTRYLEATTITTSSKSSFIPSIILDGLSSSPSVLQPGQYYIITSATVGNFINAYPSAGLAYIHKNNTVYINPVISRTGDKIEYVPINFTTVNPVLLAN